MLDTICLKLNQAEYIIIDHDKFTPSTKDLFMPPYRSFGGQAFVKSIQNPTKKLMQAEGYMPRLTVTKSLPRGKGAGFSINLKIEFSAPKLLYGNNFDELPDNSFIKICQILQKKLAIMGVEIELSKIHTAQVSAIHYSKNIPLTDYTRCKSYLDKLYKLDLRSDIDMNQTDYRNEGHSLKYHANSYEVTFYDKRKDLEASKKSEKRAVEEDNFIQQDLLIPLENMPKNVEILRLEVRIGTRQKLRSLIKKVTNDNIELNFMSLFSAKISQAILLDYWQIMQKNLKMYNISNNTPDDLLFAIEQQEGNLSVAKTLKLIGLAQIIKKEGIRGFRAMFGQHLSSSSWYTLKKQILELEKTIEETKPDREMQNITSALKAFEAVRIEDYFNESDYHSYPRNN